VGVELFYCVHGAVQSHGGYSLWAGSHRELWRRSEYWDDDDSLSAVSNSFWLRSVDALNGYGLGSL